MNRHPVFIRSGSIIPLDVVNGYAGHGDKSSAGAVTLDIYPDPARPAAFPLWDEKLGKTDITCAVKEGVTSVTLDGAAAREYVLRITAPKSPKQVRIVVAGNIRPLAELDRRGWENKSPGWRYDAADRRLWVRLRAEGETTVEVE
jgi:alpha-glucosidase (family GH31 glycosyl hydrolase)